ncbi:MAG TPA: Fe(2+)-trafficking protein [Chloroflexota bacterium]|nr:Fe(2+)-trafficking protein [Chloroflexota bacterium]
MTDIDCSRCGQRKAALDRAPLPGKYGPLVLQKTCADCWREWVEEQTRVINHEGLTPGLPEHRQVLYERMATFLKLPAN